jgi:hypothetical protein
MKKKDIPQDDRILNGCRVLNYVVDEDGRYTTGTSCGWEPANIVNIQAWEFIDQRSREIHQQVISGSISPIAYFMEISQMDASLLAKYLGLSRREVKRHLSPDVFNALEDSALEKYARIFGIQKEQLLSLPAEPVGRAAAFAASQGRKV